MIVMDLATGGSLDDLLQARKADDVAVPMSAERRLEIAVQITGALAFSHEKGVVHRDVKPGNVLLDDAVECARVCDFGLARSTGGAGHADTRHVGAGTPAYMPPEALRAATSAVSPAFDVYSVGVLLAELFTGVAPDSRVPGTTDSMNV